MNFLTADKIEAGNLLNVSSKQLNDDAVKVIKTTDKAIQVEYTTSFGWNEIYKNTAWIPKSVLVNPDSGSNVFATNKIQANSGMTTLFYVGLKFFFSLSPNSIRIK